MIKWLGAATLILLITHAAAQDITSKLSLGKSIELAIERIPAAATQCGINEDLIKASFMYPVSGSSIVVRLFDTKKNDAVPLLTISISTLLNPLGQCFSMIEMSLIDYAFYPDPEDAKRTLMVDDLLWQKNQILSSTIASHPSQVRGVIEVLTKDFVTSWNLSHKPH